MTSTTQKTDRTETFEDISKNVYVLDNLVPDWLHKQAKETIPSLPLTFGHRGLGPYQGYQFWSEQWGDSKGTDPIDLDKLGYEKLLGSGSVQGSYELLVNSFTKQFFTIEIRVC